MKFCDFASFDWTANHRKTFFSPAKTSATLLVAIETANGDSFYSSSRSADLDILSGYFSVRYVIERALAVVLLIPVIPVIFVLGCLVRLNSIWRFQETSAICRFKCLNWRNIGG